MTNDAHDPTRPMDSERPAEPVDPHAPPRDELDALLRDWHQESLATATARRDELLARIGGARTGGASWGGSLRHPAAWRDRAHRIIAAPAWRAAAVLAVAVVAGALVFLVPSRSASADAGVVQVPEGGRLDAVDREGNLIGPCPLKHTDVNAEVSGFVSRVTVTQQYANTYGRTIEAVYTFPLSHRAAVDRMRMIVRRGGEERIVEGEVKERTLARQIYESARREGFTASLLEQERPNIFTQSVANIEPGAEVLVEISYVETLSMRDGVFTFDFPMVVGPRYIPGSAEPASQRRVPQGLALRQGVVLLAPAQIRIEGEGEGLTRSAAAVLQAIDRAIPIAAPSDAWIASNVPSSTTITAIFRVRYPDGSEEPGTFRADGTGEVAGRWFFRPPQLDGDRSSRRGTGFAQGTDQVPDAGRITPMPVRPPERAGHDLSLRVSIDAGGPAVTNLRSELHRIDESSPTPARTVVTLAPGKTIPNRDFSLSWTLAGGALTEGVLTQHVPGRDGYFLLYLVPPARVAPETIRPRELVFVLDTSGSMSGFPIEKSKELMTRMLGAMRPGDTFNIITFAGDHHVLWPAPRPATEENLKIARAFVESREGGGGTEMMKAIEAALRPTSAAADRGWNGADRGAAAPGVPPTRIVSFLTDGYVGNDLAIVDAVRRYAGTTRVFGFGIGNSVNRFLLAEMARAGRGAAEFVLLPSDADEVVARFSDRVRTPVLTDLSIDFEGLQVAHVTPPADALPDLFDREPLVIAGRFTAPGRGAIRLRGTTGQGPWERTIPVDFPAGEGNSTVAAPIWARLQVDDILRPHLTALQNGAVPAPVRDMVVRLAEQHRIMSPFTSFVAVEKTRITLAGQPVLVPVPIELPQGVTWEGNFGCAGDVLKALRAPPRMMADEDGGEHRLYAFFADALAEPAALEAPPPTAMPVSGGVPIVAAPKPAAPADAAPPPAPVAPAAPPPLPPSGGGAPAPSAAPLPTLKSAEPVTAAPPATERDRSVLRVEAKQVDPGRVEDRVGRVLDRAAGSEAGDKRRQINAEVGATRPPSSGGSGTGATASHTYGGVSGGLGGGGGAGGGPGGATPGAPSGAAPSNGAPARYAFATQTKRGVGDAPDQRPAGAGAVAGKSLDEKLGRGVAKSAGATGAPAEKKPQSAFHEVKDLGGVNETAPTGETGAPSSDGKAEPPVAARARAFDRATLETISRRLEESLMLMAFEALAAMEQAGSDSSGAGAPAAPRADAAPESILVLVRFTSIDAALEKSLRAIDATIESKGSIRGVAVVRIPRHRLVDLALLDATIRVEPMPAPS